jgi:hypothetical protein
MVLQGGVLLPGKLQDAGRAHRGSGKLGHPHLQFGLLSSHLASKGVEGSLSTLCLTLGLERRPLLLNGRQTLH